MKIPNGWRRLWDWVWDMLKDTTVAVVRTYPSHNAGNSCPPNLWNVQKKDGGIRHVSRSHQRQYAWVHSVSDGCALHVSERLYKAVGFAA